MLSQQRAVAGTDQPPQAHGSCPQMARGLLMLGPSASSRNPWPLSTLHWETPPFPTLGLGW